MPQRKIPLAIIYDFDGTLAAGNMQERDFIPAIGMTTSDFWDEVKRRAKHSRGDEILMYMGLMLEKADAAEVPVKSDNFREFGEALELFQGVTDYRPNDTMSWFEWIDSYCKESAVSVDHYILSSGIAEMVEGTSIAKHFTKIYASRFYYDQYGKAVWPALGINYTNKTQFLFRINKGSLDEHDHSVINQYTPLDDRPVPFSNMIYIGDGETDIPCFRTVKSLGGFSLAVYRPNTAKARIRPDKLLKDGRVQFVAPADYREGKRLDKIIKSIIDKLQVDADLNRLMS